MSGIDINTALEHWEYSLISENRRPRTMQTYLLAGTQLRDFLKRQGRPIDVTDIHKVQVRQFLGEKLAKTSAATARQRHSSLSQFFRWLEAEGEIVSNPMATLRPPKVIERPIPLVTPDEFKALMDSCDPKTFIGRRDAAILSILRDCGLRLGEITALTVDDINLKDRIITVTEGKGGMSRVVPFTRDTAPILSRYMMRRERHKAGHLDDLWLGKRGKLGERGISQMVNRKGEVVGRHLHAHMFRHTATDRLLASGMPEGSVMAIMGWSEGSRSMLSRYGRAGQERRALDAYERLVG